MRRHQVVEVGVGRIGEVSAVNAPNRLGSSTPINMPMPRRRRSAVAESDLTRRAACSRRSSARTVGAAANSTADSAHVGQKPPSMYSPPDALGSKPSANANTPRIISPPTTGTTIFWIATMVAWPYSATVTISAATAAYARACTMSLSGVPSRRCPAATSASPLVHTVTAAKASAIAKARPEPMNRPRIPKNAPLETVMFVPVRGPMIAVGSTATVPTAVPTAIEATVCQKLRPNRIAKAPKTTFVQVRLAPRNTADRLRGPESRASSGRYSTPAASIAPTRSSVGSTAGAGRVAVMAARFILLMGSSIVLM